MFCFFWFLNFNILGSTIQYHPVLSLWIATGFLYWPCTVNVMPCVLMFVLLFYFSQKWNPSLKSYTVTPTYNGAILTLRHVEICFNFILFFSVTNCCFHIGKSMWERSRVEHGFINGRDCWMFQTLEWILSFGTWGYANFYIIVLFCFFFLCW